MNALELYEKDDEKRNRCGWGKMSFIAPKIPKPRTEAEKACQEILGKDGVEHGYMYHIYDVLELMEKAYIAGKLSD